MNHVIIVAGGTGRRLGLGYNKIFAKLLDRPVLSYTIENFVASPVIDQIVVCAGNPQDGTAEMDGQRVREILEQEDLLERVQVVSGAATRMQSVQCGLDVLSLEEDHIVLIQDASRPFTSQSLIEELIEAAQTHGASICGVKPKDTIQRVDESGCCVQTYDRETLRAIATPVAVKWGLLRAAREKARKEGYLDTPGFEDSALLQQNGVPTYFIDCGYTNIKLTTQEDLFLAERLLSERV